MEWDKQVLEISDELMGILCEGLGLRLGNGNSNKLKEMSMFTGKGNGGPLLSLLPATGAYSRVDIAHGPWGADGTSPK